jgi:hypothetical protein
MIIDILEALRNEERSHWLITLMRGNALLEQIQQFLARDLSIDTSSSVRKMYEGPDLGIHVK